MNVNLRRVLVGAAAAALAALAWAPAATAADPVSVAVSDVQVAEGQITGALTLRSKSQVLVDPGSMTATIGAASAPVSITQGQRAVRRAMLVIDTSGSMGRAGMSTVRDATDAFLKAVPDDVKVGVVSFDNTAGVDLAPTSNRGAVRRVVDGLVSRGNTALFDGMQSALKALGPIGDRSIILLSDGADTVATNPEAAQRRIVAGLDSAAVRVDVIRFRSTDPAAGSTLQAFARANGGSVTSASDTDGVVDAFNASAKALESQVQFRIQAPPGLKGEQVLLIKGRANGQPFSVARKFNAAASPVVQPPADPVPVGSDDGAGEGAPLALPAITGTSEPWYPIAAAGLLAIGLFGIIAAAFAPALVSSRQQRIRSIENYVVGPRTVSRSENKQEPTPLTERLTQVGEQVMKNRRFTSWVSTRLETADLPLRLGDWFVVTATSSIVGMAVGYVLTRRFPLAGIGVGFVLGVVLPQLVLSILARRRMKKFEAVLPDVLMLVATSLRSGFGLPQALDAVARDAAEPAAKEFSRALAETRIGTDVADALEHAAQRMGSKSLHWTIMAIRIQREVGGNLANTLYTTAATLRERESLYRQVRALSAEGRMSAWILTAIPIFLFIYLCLVNRPYISLLWTRPIGLAMIGAAVVMISVGALWMRRLVKIEV